jgi:hypothetical protein
MLALKSSRRTARRHSSSFDMTARSGTPAFGLIAAPTGRFEEGGAGGRVRSRSSGAHMSQHGTVGPWVNQ